MVGAGARAAALRLLGVAALVGLPACFHLDKVPPGPFVVDDFEDEDAVPLSSRFEDWACRALEGDEPPDADGGVRDAAEADGGVAPAPGDDASQVVCGIDRGGDRGSRFSLAARVTVEDPPDGIRQRGGIVIIAPVRSGTPDQAGSIDLSRFRQLTFSAILDSDPPPRALPATPQLRVELTCAVGSRSTFAYQMATGLGINADWATFPLPLASFVMDNASLPIESCLLGVNAIRFAFRPGLADGQSAAGTLRLDEVYLLE